MIDIRSARLRVLMLAMASVAILAFAACGSDDGGDDEGGSDPTATTKSNDSNSPTATSQSSSQPTSTPLGGFGDFGDFLDNACSFIEFAVDLPDAVLDTSASDEPSSATTRDISNYFAMVIEDALGSGTPTCYLESTIDGEFGMWVSFSLDGNAPSNAADLLRDELIDRGVAEDDVESFSLSFGGSGFNTVTATNVSILGQYSDGEVTMLVSGDNVVLAVEDDGDSFSGSTPTPFPTFPTATPEDSMSPAATATTAPDAVPAGTAAEIDEFLRPALEQALGVSLSLTNYFNASGQGVSSVTLSYQLDDEITVNVESKLRSVIEALNGVVLFSGGTSDSVIVSYSGLPVDGDPMAGTLGLDGNEVIFIGATEG